MQTSRHLESFTRSSSFMSNREALNDAMVKWESLKIYIYFAFVLFNHVENFALFSQVFAAIRLYDFLILQVTIGSSYMFLDMFIKLYTGKLDFNTTLHPLLRGICFGILLQHSLALVVFAKNNLDALRYFFFSLKSPPQWTECPKGYNNCFTSDEILYRCNENILTQTHLTAHYAVYNSYVLGAAKSEITLRTVLNFGIWTINFFLSSVSTATILKIVKFAFYENILTTFFCCVVVLFQTKDYLRDTMLSLLSVKVPCDHDVLVLYVCELYSIGYIGVYDFNMMSPHTLVDNAVMIFAVFIVFYLLMRSVLVDILVKVLENCVTFDSTKVHASTQVTVFVLLPLGIQFLHAQKLLEILLFFNSVVSHTVILALMTAIMARLLRSEFRKIKEVYISGILCFIGFCCSVTMSMFTDQLRAMIRGSLYMRSTLAAVRVAIIMWAYGVEKFSTDIEFWLGYKPIKFWKYCWVIAPIPFMFTAGKNIYLLYSDTFTEEVIVATVWIVLTVFIVLFGQMKMISSFMARNDFMAAFRSSRKYGPPMEEDRSLRRNYDETSQFHKCDHTCIMLDERIDCMHEPSTFQFHDVSEGSITHYLKTDIEPYEDVRRRSSNIMETKATRFD